MSSRRKRKHEEDDDSEPIAPDTVESLAAVPLTDEEKISSILTKRLLSDNVGGVIEAMESLAEMLNSEENQKTAFRRGAPLAIFYTMRRFEDSYMIQGNGLFILVNICICTIGNTSHKSTKQDIIAVGGLKCCLEAMGRHQDESCFVHVNGCVLIGNLWSVPGLRKKVVDEGGLEAVINAMEDNDEHTLLQRIACGALKALLLFEVPAWVYKKVANEGCIDLVITAMNNHPDDADLQMEACAFLTILSKAHEDYRDMIIEAEGLGPIGDAIRVHKENAQVKLAARKAFIAISA